MLTYYKKQLYYSNSLKFEKGGGNMTRTVRYGIIGCGQHALRSHALPGKNVPNLSLVSIFDPSYKAMLCFEAKYDTPLIKYASEDDLLRSNVDAVLIASPDHFHAMSLNRTVKAGKHVLVEKPLATTEAQWPLVTEALAIGLRDKLVVTSCHPRRFDPAFIWLKDNLRGLTEKLGTPISLSFDFSYQEPPHDWKRNRGLLIDHINHEIDLLGFLFGISAFEVHKICDTPDRYEAFGCALGSPGRQLAFHFHGTRRLKTKRFIEICRLRFDHGEVEMDLDSNQVTFLDHDSYAPSTMPLAPKNYDEMSANLMLSFVNAILSDAPWDAFSGKTDNYLSIDDILTNNIVGVKLATTNSCRINY